jgi:hypothetical protein
MIGTVQGFILPAAFSVLPPIMESTEAKAMLLAIGLQESRFLHRRQTNYGPARGFWQFEKVGIRGVSRHPASMGHLTAALRALRYEAFIGETANLHYAIEDNDVLAAVFARLLLWTLPGALPGRGQADHGWAQYLDAWRPGKPHPETWRTFFDEAWTLITLESEP